MQIKSPKRAIAIMRRHPARPLIRHRDMYGTSKIWWRLARDLGDLGDDSGKDFSHRIHRYTIDDLCRRGLAVMFKGRRVILVPEHSRNAK